MTCKNCGENLVGDGYTSATYCPNSNFDTEGREPDAEILYCTTTKWDYRFLDMAKLVASWSKDPSTKVGAVIADNKNRVISMGYNGPARGVQDINLKSPEDRDRRLMRTIHAEVNAILFAGRDHDAATSTLYVTAPPCANCAALIIQYGIRRVVAIQADPDFLRRWYGSIGEVKMMFADVGGTLEVIDYA